jgi:hypothetical protein
MDVSLKKKKSPRLEVWLNHLLLKAMNSKPGPTKKKKKSQLEFNISAIDANHL